MDAWLLFQRVKRCSQAGQEGAGTAPSELSRVLTGQSYVLLIESQYQSSTTCHGAARGKPGQLRNGDGFLKVLADKGRGTEGSEGGVELIRFMFSQND